MSDNLPAKVSESLFSKEEEEDEEEVAMWDFLPPEILPNILLRLPTKSIVKFTSVCKTWRSLIRNPDFISAHLKLSNHNQPLLLFRFCSDSRLKQPYLDRDTDEKEVYKLYCHNQDFNEHARFDFPFHTQGRLAPFGVVGTCNGLVCVRGDGFSHRIILWNPCVRMFVELPPPSITYLGFYEDDVYGYNATTGLGFDSKTNDYKVVRVVTVVDGWRWDWGVSPPKVEVYSLATGVWSMVTTALPGAVHPCDRMPFVNGALHWVALRRTNYEKYRNFITVLDLGDMVFREIELPILSDEKDYGNESHIHPVISAYGNSLALIHRGRGLCLNVWLMKRYADASSWTKIVIFPHNGTLDQAIKDIEDVAYGFIPWAKGFRKGGEVVVELGEQQPFVSQDLETEECKDLPISACNYTFVGSYVESLVLLDKPNRAATY